MKRIFYPLAAVGIALGFATSYSAVFAQSAQPDWSKAQTVTISMSNYAFEPKSLHLKSGQPYRLHFTNTASGGHNFDAKEFFAALTVSTADKAKIEDGKVEVDPMQAVDIDVVPAKAGTYAVTCSHFMHTMMGMKGEAVIE